MNQCQPRSIPQDSTAHLTWAHSPVTIMTLGKRISAISSEGNNALSRPALSGKIYPFEVFIPQGTGGLDRDSKIMLDQIRSLDKRRLRNKIGAVSHDILIKASAIAQRLISVE